MKSYRFGGRYLNKWCVRQVTVHLGQQPRRVFAWAGVGDGGPTRTVGGGRSSTPSPAPPADRSVATPRTAIRQRERAQYLPPRLDQAQVRGVRRLEQELPPRVRQAEQQHVGRAVDQQVGFSETSGTFAAITKRRKLARGGRVVSCLSTTHTSRPAKRRHSASGTRAKSKVGERRESGGVRLEELSRDGMKAKP